MTFNDLIKQSKDTPYLQKTTFVNLIPEKEFRTALTSLYNSKKNLHKLIATVLNSIYTEDKRVFWISHQYLLDLVKQDASNLKYRQRKGIHIGESAVYFNHLRKNVIKWFEDSDDFIVHHEACKGNSAATMIELVGKELIKTMDEQGVFKDTDQRERAFRDHDAILDRKHEEAETENTIQAPEKQRPLSIVTTQDFKEYAFDDVAFGLDELNL